jgi:hypothetical protein
MMNQQGTQTTVSVKENALAKTVKAMRPMVPAKDFETIRRFYEELGFRAEVLADGLAPSLESGVSFDTPTAARRFIDLARTTVLSESRPPGSCGVWPINHELI